MNKRGIELSVNFLVMLIIAIAVFGFGITFATKLFKAAGDKSEVYDQQIQAQLEQLLDDGSRVAVPINRKEVGRKEMATFGVGILNVDPGAEPIGNPEFKIFVIFKGAYNDDGSALCSPLPSCVPYDPNAWIRHSGTRLLDSQGEIKIINTNNKEKFVFGIIPGPSAERKATYVYNLKVCYDDGDGTGPPTPCDSTYPDYYGSSDVYKIYVKVI